MGTFTHNEQAGLHTPSLLDHHLPVPKTHMLLCKGYSLVSTTYSTDLTLLNEMQQATVTHVRLIHTSLAWSTIIFQNLFTVLLHLEHCLAMYKSAKIDIFMLY